MQYLQFVEQRREIGYTVDVGSQGGSGYHSVSGSKSHSVGHLSKIGAGRENVYFVPLLLKYVSRQRSVVPVVPYAQVHLDVQELITTPVAASCRGAIGGWDIQIFHDLFIYGS